MRPRRGFLDREAGVYLYLEVAAFIDPDWLVELEGDCARKRRPRFSAKHRRPWHADLPKGVHAALASRLGVYGGASPLHSNVELGPAFRI